jgi:hypothetical protein
MMAMPVVARPTTEDRIRAALWFAERGFGVFSVWSTHPNGECKCGPTSSTRKANPDHSCDQPGKHPVPGIGFKAATTDPQSIRAMLDTRPEPNWGMLPPEGVFILDVDGDGVARLAELETKHGPLPPTLRTNTAHGQHVFLRWPAELPRPIGQMFGYITRWGTGASAGYVVGPRSVHASGAVYAPVEPLCEIAELPEAWAQATIAPAAASVDGIEIGSGGYELPAPGYSGGRYNEILRYAGSRYMRGIPKEEVFSGVVHVLAPLFADPLTEPELRSRFERCWKTTPAKFGPPMVSEGGKPKNAPRRVPAVGVDAAELLARDIPPLRWVVPGLIPEGTTILAAPPKVGKSCLVYQIAVEASIGGELLGRRVTPGSVLYLALEDGERRGRDRLLAVLAGRTMPAGRLEIRWSANLIGGGLESDISSWLDEHDDAVMVAVDTLGKVRPGSTGKQGAYEVDVQALAGLQDLFRNRPIALVIVHHARKEASDDFLASVSGTYGITGSADTIVVLRRKRLEKFGNIYTTGRDIADGDIPVEFDGLTWRAAPGSLSAARFERTEVYEVIRRRGPVFAKAIADEIGKERSNVQHLIDGLVGDGAVARVSGGYAVAGVLLELKDPPNTPTHSIHSESESSERGDTRARRAETVRQINEMLGATDAPSN